MNNFNGRLSRRHFVTGAVAGSSLLGLGLTANIAHATKLNSAELAPPNPFGPETLRGNNFNLTYGYQDVNFTGYKRVATAVNGSVPAPILRWTEGETVTINVSNNMAIDTSIHWHGMILPTGMDGVPGLSFDGIKPGASFKYQFKVKQSGTYWYHSHSGFQEQTGAYGAIVIDPIEPVPYEYDRDYVVLLSDWSDEKPENVYTKLKKMSHYYNFSERTAGNLLDEIKEKGVMKTWSARSMWNNMRMSDRDISDVTGYTYTYLMNGQTPDQGWVGLFNKGEKIRLRFINAAAMTFFDIRIPGLKMTVIASDGQNIQPVSIDEFRIGVAETYDVIVEPLSDVAYTVFAQTIDRTGYALGSLTPDIAIKAPIPDMDPAPVLTHMDMGMDHAAMGHNMSSMKGMDHAAMGHDMSPMKGMDHAAMGHDMPSMKMDKPKIGSGIAGYGSSSKITHVKTEFGPHIDMRTEAPIFMLDDPGIGLRDHQKLYGRKVLTYSDIKNLTKTQDRREPEREIELHLTGNMSRYMWSLNGIKFADAKPLKLKFGERLRITLVNDTMMNHPMHLHGMWSELETGDADYIPRKHTIIVQPGAKVSYLVTADAKGRWAFHCHLIYHMLGMFREVSVS